MTDRLHITPGRFQPPHGGHELTIQAGEQAAAKEKADHWVVPSRTEGNEQNPIPFAQKLGFLRRLFPNIKIIDHPEVKNLFGALRHAANLGYKNITVHAGEGRAQEYEQSVKPYIKKVDDPEYNPERDLPFDSFKVVQSGKRDEAGEGVLGFSGSHARKSTRKEYRAMAPRSAGHKLADQIYNAMRRGQAAVAAAKVKKKPRKKRLAEEITHKEFGPMLDSFTSFASKELGLLKVPKVNYKEEDSDVTSFGGYNPSTREIMLQTKNRHPMDIFRTLAHEFVHAKQHEDGEIGHDIEAEGKTGSDHENKANSIAGVIMRKYGKANPKHFNLKPLKEAIFVVGGPCSGKDKVVRTLKEQLWLPEMDMSALTQKQPHEERVIVNGSAHNLDAIRTANEMLKNLNYQTSMIFVDVEDKISKLRNEQRAVKGQRVINESVRLEKYTASRNNIEEFKKLFGENMTIIDNSVNEEEVKKPTGELKKACWKGYTAVGFKKKNGKRVPNCVPVSEEGRCWSGYEPVKGKKAYSKGSCKPVKETFIDKLEEKRKVVTKKDKDFEKYMADDKIETAGTRINEKKKIMKRKLNQEGLLDNAAGNVGLPVNGDSIGAEFGVSKVPGLVSGLGTGWSFPFGTFSESVQKWIMKEETQQKFIKKYGDNAQQKLLEAATNINKSMNTNVDSTPKSFSQLRESPEGAGMGTVPATNRSRDEERSTVGEEWSDVKHQDPRGGLKASGVRAYRREHPGSKLKTAVREEPSKLKKGGKRWNRRKSFCSRMQGMKDKLTSAKTARDPDSRINKSLRAWNCEE